MQTYALYGLIYAVATAGLTVLSYFLGLQTDHIALGMYVQTVVLIGFFVVLYLGVKEARENRPDQKMGFGAAWWGAIAISLVAGILSAAYTYVHFSKINPAFGDYYIQYTQSKMMAAGVPEDMVEKMTSRMSSGFTPLRQTINAFVGTVFMGLVFGLMLAPGNTQKGSIVRISIVNGAVGAFFGCLFGAANGMMYRALGSYAGLGFVIGGLCMGVTTFLLLKLTKYTPRFANEPSM